MAAVSDSRLGGEPKGERPLPEGTALSVEMLPAAFGDALIVRAPAGDGEFRMVVDTGPDDRCLAALRSRLALVPQIGGRRRADLLVVTHIDHDHIGNATALLRDETLGLDFGDVWFNGAEQVAPYAAADPRDNRRSVIEGEEVSKVIADRGFPFNRAFGGKAVVVEDDAARWRAIPAPDGSPRLTVLSPRPTGLQDLARVWRDALTRLRCGQPDSAEDDTRRGRIPDRPPIDLGTLARTPFRADRSVPNRSSIVLLVEHRGASVLLAADGRFGVYGPALAALLTSRGRTAPRIDAVKLAHHGSRGNTQAELSHFRARHYLVSSDNGVYGLPDDETIARLVMSAHPRVQPTFWFNYATPLNLRWAEIARTSGRLAARYPDELDAGIVLDLPAHTAGA